MRGKAILVLMTFVTLANGQLLSFEKLKSYARIFKFDALAVNDTGNELWHGLFRDCDKKVTFSCIQKNAYTYLDNAFVDRDNISMFDGGLTMMRNRLEYDSCSGQYDERREDNLNENLVDTSDEINCEKRTEEDDGKEESGRNFGEESASPLEEITNALRKKTVKFLATRNYEIQLPQFFDGATIKISPREVDENGALVRIDIGERAIERQGRIFKKIRKFIQNKLMMSFLALLLLIKLIKVKFMFVIPFLFGVGTAKKLFLKLLLFFIPAFAHIFKLCSSYYSSHHTKYHHHHHHQIAHHHHHVPVPVPVPTYYDHHHHPHDDEFDGFDYAHPHIQYRKDVEELKEWGIEPYEEPYEEVNQRLGPIPPMPGTVPAPISAPIYNGPYGIPQYAPNVRPIASYYQDKHPISPHNLAYSSYLDEQNKFNRRLLIQQPTIAAVTMNPTNLVPSSIPKTTNLKNPYSLNQQNSRVITKQRVSPTVISPKNSIISKPAASNPMASNPAPSNPVSNSISRHAYDDEYYGPIVDRLEEIFGQLRFYEESCRERLVCSMYKSPSVYSPHSNLVSHELSRDPQELKRGATETVSSEKFHRYLNAARLGQDGGDCLRTYPCHINTE